MKTENRTPWWKNGHNLMMAGCVAIAAYLFLFTDTRLETALLFLACPLMHLFMMKGMGHDCHSKSDTSDESGKEAVQPGKQSTPARKDF